MSLHGTYDPDNIFAKIIRGEMPSIRVFEDEAAIAFLDIFPQSDGHTLVIPKGHAIRNFIELPPAAVGAYMERVHTVARAVAAALEPDGVIVTQFNGASAGQTVFHLHFHIIPRWNDKPLKGHGAAGRADAAALEAIAAQIRAKIAD